MRELQRVGCEDSKVALSLLKSEFVNLTVTSPPYNLKSTTKKNPVVYDVYHDDMTLDNYLQWLESVFTQVHKCTVQGGRCVINIGDQKNGAIPVHSYITSMMEKIGWGVYATIIWDKQQTRNRCAWGSWLSPSSPSFPSPFEYILIFYKGERKLQHKGESDLTKEEFIDWAYGMWRFPPETKLKQYGHPAMFPEELPKRCIKLLSYPGDVVLDPFAGVGTTGVVARRLGRQFLLYDISETYCSQAEERIFQ